MIIKNYNKQNHFNLDTGTRIKGIIEMNYKEWCEVYHFLQEVEKEAHRSCETYKRDAIGHALDIFDRHKPFSLGICATFEIIKKYNLLDKHKNQNYAIVIK